MTSETEAKDATFQGADFGMWLKGKWSCRWRTINFWTFLICRRDVPLGHEIKCRSGWAQKQIAACNLLSLRIITYIFIFLIDINAELDHIHRTFIHSWFPLSFALIVPCPWARQMEIFMRLNSSKYKRIIHWVRLSWQTNCITPHTKYVATASPFCCIDGDEGIFRGSRVSRGRGHEFTALYTWLYNLLCTALLLAPVKCISLRVNYNFNKNSTSRLLWR